MLSAAMLCSGAQPVYERKPAAGHAGVTNMLLRLVTRFSDAGFVFVYQQNNRPKTKPVMLV